MNRLKKKLNSQRGASITWALLIFLVCAVVGSSVLAAGMASSGRMSRISESDQRYYAVNSAARLLCDIIPRNAVVIEQTTVSDISDPEVSDSVTYTLQGKTGDFTKNQITSFPILAAYQLGYLGETELDDGPPSFSLRADSDELSDTEKSALSANIEETVYPDGRLVLTISKSAERQNNDTLQYALQLTFVLTNGLPELEPIGPSVVDDENGSETITKTATLQWQLSDIEVINS